MVLIQLLQATPIDGKDRNEGDIVSVPVSVARYLCGIEFAREIEPEPPVDNKVFVRGDGAGNHEVSTKPFVDQPKRGRR